MPLWNSSDYQCLNSESTWKTNNTTAILISGPQVLQMFLYTNTPTLISGSLTDRGGKLMMTPVIWNTCVGARQHLEHVGQQALRIQTNQDCKRRRTLTWTSAHGVPLHTLPKGKGGHISVGVNALLHVAAPHALRAAAGALAAGASHGTRGPALLRTVVGWREIWRRRLLLWMLLWLLWWALWEKSYDCIWTLKLH